VFGLQDLLLDQHVLQRGRIARLINSSFVTSELGVGVDADTAATIENGTTVTEIGGASATFVADPLTFTSGGQFDSTGTLSIHDIATHVFPAGDGYLMDVRQPVVGDVPIAPPRAHGPNVPESRYAGW
jgi:cyanophycinase